jgi:hypothetical protein
MGVQVGALHDSTARHWRRIATSRQPHYGARETVMSMTGHTYSITGWPSARRDETLRPCTTLQPPTSSGRVVGLTASARTTRLGSAVPLAGRHAARSVQSPLIPGLRLCSSRRDWPADDTEGMAHEQGFSLRSHHRGRFALRHRQQAA